MKKKLNIFCVIMFIILAVDACLLIGASVHSFVSGFQAGYNEAAQTEAPTGEVVTLSVLPTELSSGNAFKGTDKSTGKTYEVWPVHLMTKASVDRGIAAKALDGVAGLAVIAAGVASIVVFIRFIIGINRNEVFAPRTIRRLRLIGWMFAIMCAGQLVSGLINLSTYSGIFMQHGHTLNYIDFIPFDGLIFAVFLFIMAEVFTIGARMKEEQELTV